MKKTMLQFTSAIIAIAMIFVSYQNASALPLLSPAQAPNTYYVSPSGNDLNSCTVSAPCKSFNKVMSLAVSGDTIIALAGTYNQSIVISKSGITIQGNNAIINTSTTHGIKVSSTAQNVVVRGFTVTGTLSHAIYVEGKFVTIEANTVYHTVLSNGTVSGGVITCGSGPWGSAIKLGLGSSNVTVRGNTVYENCGEGIAATRSSNVVIENNTVYDNKAVNIYVDNSFNVKVLNNTSYCTKSTGNIKGIALGEEYYSGWGAQLKDVTISDNTITNCHAGVATYESEVGGILTNVNISNNYIPYGQKRGISIDSALNSNMLISNNTHFNDIWIRNPIGVTLVGNIKVSGTPSGAQTTFSDVPINHPYFEDIEILYANGYSAGCSTTSLMFCPDMIMNRAQGAVFMLRGEFGTAYSPPAPPWNTFLDNFSPGTWAQPWVQGMFDEGLTAGCSVSPNLYCPWEQLPRVQAAVFGLRLKYGIAYFPPPASGTLLADVTDPTFWGAHWTEQAYIDGLIPACGTSEGKPLFCPNELVTRGLGAYLIVHAKDLEMP